MMLVDVSVNFMEGLIAFIYYVLKANSPFKFLRWREIFPLILVTQGTGFCQRGCCLSG